MSKHSKKQKRKEMYEDNRLGGVFPWIDVEYTDGQAWLLWVYHVAPFQVRVEIPLTGKANETPWLYLNGNDSLLEKEEARTKAEAQYGAMTRIRLMEAHAAEIIADTAAGLAKLEEAATKAGLFGKRERRYCVTPRWRTLDETKLLTGKAQ